MIRLVFFFIGLAVFSGLIWHIGPSLIAQTANQLGFVSIGIILLPLLAGYLVDAYGWQLTLGHWADRVSFFHLFAVRMAGEAVNATTPTGMVGGEPVKAYLLKPNHMAMMLSIQPGPGESEVHRASEKAW